MKKVLFLAYLFPPILNSGTYRSIKFTKYLPNYYWKPTVVTVKDPPDTPLNNDLLNLIPSNIDIIRIPLTSRCLAECLAKLLPHSYKKKIADAIEWRIRKFFFFPDSHASWLYSAFRSCCSLLNQGSFNIIFATGYPWTSFWIAYKLHKKFRIPYVLDYRDPWTGNPLWNNLLKTGFKEKIKKKLSPLLEEKLVYHAKAIVVTTDTFAKVIQNKFNHPRVYVITNGFDPIFYQQKSKQISVTKPIKIAYTGIWKQGYGPEGLYQALKILKSKYPDISSKIEVITAGFLPGAAKKFAIVEIVKELGPVSYQKAANILSSADLLFLPVAPGRFAQECIPGKFFDYIGAKKPIVLMAPKNSLLWKMLADKDFVFKFSHDEVEKLSDFLKKITENFQILNKTPDEDFRIRFDISILTKKLADIFDGCIKNYA